MVERPYAMASSDSRPAIRIRLRFAGRAGASHAQVPNIRVKTAVNGRNEPDIPDGDSGEATTAGLTKTTVDLAAT
jgi:hypothetical protein